MTLLLEYLMGSVSMLIIFCDLIICLCLGKFLGELLEVISRWHGQVSIYEKVSILSVWLSVYLYKLSGYWNNCPGNQNAVGLISSFGVAVVSLSERAWLALLLNGPIVVFGCYSFQFLWTSCYSWMCIRKIAYSAFLLGGYSCFSLWHGFCFLCVLVCIV